jgi:hypothetical protein
MKTWQFTASTAGKLGITEQALVVKSVILSKEYGKIWQFRADIL